MKLKPFVSLIALAAITLTEGCVVTDQADTDAITPPVEVDNMCIPSEWVVEVVSSRMGPHCSSVLPHAMTLFLDPRERTQRAIIVTKINTAKGDLVYFEGDTIGIYGLTVDRDKAVKAQPVIIDNLCTNEIEFTIRWQQGSDDCRLDFRARYIGDGSG